MLDITRGWKSDFPSQDIHAVYNQTPTSWVVPLILVNLLSNTVGQFCCTKADFRLIKCSYTALHSVFIIINWLKNQYDAICDNDILWCSMWPNGVHTIDDVYILHQLPSSWWPHSPCPPPIATALAKFLAMLSVRRVQFFNCT